MKATLRVFWILTLLIFAAGCSTYQVAALPRYGEQGPELEREEELAKVGDTVKIRLVDGPVVHGRVQAISAEELTLYPLLSAAGNPYKLPPRTIPAEKVRVIELYKANLTKSILLGVIVAGSLVGIGLGINAFGEAMQL